MMTKRTLLQHGRIVVYHGGILFSVGLIWGGGLALLRGSIPEGLVAVVIGILLQIGLWRVDVDRQPVPNPDEDRVMRHGSLQVLEEGSGAKTVITEAQRSHEPSMTETASWKEQFRGTDGAMLKGERTPRLAARMVALDDTFEASPFAEKSSLDNAVFIVDGERIITTCSSQELQHYFRRRRT